MKKAETLWSERSPLYISDPPYELPAEADPGARQVGPPGHRAHHQREQVGGEIRAQGMINVCVQISHGKTGEDSGRERSRQPDGTAV